MAHQIDVTDSLPLGRLVIVMKRCVLHDVALINQVVCKHCPWESDFNAMPAAHQSQTSFWKRIMLHSVLLSTATATYRDANEAACANTLLLSMLVVRMQLVAAGLKFVLKLK